MALETWSPSGSLFGSGGINGKPPGDGWAQTGTTKVQVYAPPKAGWNARWKTVPVYTRQTPQAAPAAEPAPAPAPEPEPAPAAPAQLPVSTPAEPKGPTMADIASQFSSQIQEMQKGFMESMQAQAAQFQQMQAAQQERMASLQQQMLQSQIQQQQRPEVAGVKMATGAAGTAMQIARRGVTGAFGRRGMRISSLNV